MDTGDTLKGEEYDAVRKTLFDTASTEELKEMIEVLRVLIEAEDRRKDKEMLSEAAFELAGRSSLLSALRNM